MQEAFTQLLVNLANIFKIKSLITLALTVGLVLLLTGQFDPPKEILALYCTAYGSIITYFFNKQDSNTDSTQKEEGDVGI